MTNEEVTALSPEQMVRAALKLKNVDLWCLHQSLSDLHEADRLSRALDTTNKVIRERILLVVTTEAFQEAKKAAAESIGLQTEVRDLTVKIKNFTIVMVLVGILALVMSVYSISKPLLRTSAIEEQGNRFHRDHQPKEHDETPAKSANASHLPRSVEE